MKTMMPYQTLYYTLAAVSCVLVSLGSIQQASIALAAPIPPPLTRQPRHTFNNTYFPYDITGPAPPPLNKAGQVLQRCTAPNSYAISFDDGPGQLTDELLDLLKEQNLQVTFFLNGDNWSCIYRPESQRLLRRAYELKHQIAAHPWSHRDLESLSDKDIRQEMHKIEQAFRQILGVVPRYMRPPYGEHGERVRRVLEDMGYILVLWDVDQLGENESSMSPRPSNPTSTPSLSTAQRPMVIDRHHHHREEQESFSSKWAEAVRGVPSATLDRAAMVLGGIYQEATPMWAVEYVQSLGYDVMPVGRCLGEEDPRLWYKEIGPPADPESLPQSCH